ncbi:feruloyl esterase, partial [Exophiala aquamarina CBS 119918]
GGKVLTYHGQADGVTNSFNSARYYELVAANMSLSPSALDEFYRFFRISGMVHCRRVGCREQVRRLATGGQHTREQRTTYHDQMGGGRRGARIDYGQRLRKFN